MMNLIILWSVKIMSFKAGANNMMDAVRCLSPPGHIWNREHTAEKNDTTRSKLYV